jgi:hypothetical protein
LVAVAAVLPLLPLRYQAESKAFVIGVNTAGTAAYCLERFDTQHFTQEQPGIRFGRDGLAYVVPSTATSNKPQIFLLRGPFVVPAEATTNPAPTLSSTGQATIAVASSNLYLTVTGTGFLPGAVVLWKWCAAAGTQTSTSLFNGASCKLFFVGLRHAQSSSKCCRMSTFCVTLNHCQTDVVAKRPTVREIL